MVWFTLWNLGWDLLWLTSVAFVLWRKFRYGEVSLFMWNPPKWQRRTWWLRELGWHGLLVFTVSILGYTLFVFGLGIVAFGTNEPNAYVACAVCLVLVNVFAVGGIWSDLFESSEIY